MATALVFLCFGDAPLDDSGQTAHDAAPITDDRERVARLREGDSAEFDALMVAMWNPLVRFAVGFVHDSAAGEDLVQEVFVRLWNERATLQVERLSSYLYRAVRNRALNAMKHDRVRARVHDAVRETVAPAPIDSPAFDRADEDPRVAVVRTALRTLPERRQTAVRLRYDQGLSYPELAAVLGITVNAAQQLVFHAIRALQQAVQASSPPEA